MGERQDGFGPPDLPSLLAIRDTAERHEPLVSGWKFDDSIDTQQLTIFLSVGFEESGRFDIRWSITDCYSFHYTEDGLDFRFDAHPNPHSPHEHFHPPPNADTAAAESSCIEVGLPEMVTLAVMQLWRAAWKADDLSLLNRSENPP